MDHNINRVELPLEVLKANRDQLEVGEQGGPWVFHLAFQVIIEGNAVVLQQKQLPPLRLIHQTVVLGLNIKPDLGAFHDPGVDSWNPISKINVVQFGFELLAEILVALGHLLFFLVSIQVSLGIYEVDQSGFDVEGLGVDDLDAPFTGRVIFNSLDKVAALVDVQLSQVHRFEKFTILNFNFL